MADQDVAGERSPADDATAARRSPARHVDRQARTAKGEPGSWPRGPFRDLAPHEGESFLRREDVEDLASLVQLLEHYWGARSDNHIAAASSVARQTISNLRKTGKRTPDVETLFRVARELGLRITAIPLGRQAILSEDDLTQILNAHQGLHERVAAMREAEAKVARREADVIRRRAKAANDEALLDERERTIVNRKAAAERDWKAITPRIRKLEDAELLIRFLEERPPSG